VAKKGWKFSVREPSGFPARRLRRRAKIQRRGFAQSRFEFCPKDTASWKKRLLARPLRECL